MGKNHITFEFGRAQGKCVVCRTPFKGPGDRCPTHRQQLIQRRKRKPR